MQTICVIHGPNLNLLGTREPEIYGSETLVDIDDGLRKKAEALGLTLKTFQSNHEGAIVDQIQSLRENCDGLIINPGALTHTSIAIRDALLGVALPIIEVHISNVFARERFRHKNLISDIAIGSIVGLGTYGYGLALDAAIYALNMEDDD